MIKNTVRKLKRGLKIYRQYGSGELIEAFTSYVLTGSPIASYLRGLLGKRVHQKILRYPSLRYWPQIKQPRTYNEKLMHRKLYTDKPIFSEVEDKWKVRRYVKNKISEDILPDVYSIVTDPLQISFDTLPNKFVIKPSHLSGDVLIVDDKSKIDQNRVRKQCSDWLSKKHGLLSGEYWYDNIKPRIIIEELIQDDRYNPPLDYKFFVFHGDVKYIQVDHGRFTKHSRRFYNDNWEPQDFTLGYPQGPVIEEPDQLKKMINIAEELGDEFDHIRVDLYQPNGEQVIFGELTVAHGSAAERFNPREVDFEFGQFWEL